MRLCLDKDINFDSLLSRTCFDISIMSIIQIIGSLLLQ